MIRTATVVSRVPSYDDIIREIGRRWTRRHFRWRDRIRVRQDEDSCSGKYPSLTILLENLADDEREDTSDEETESEPDYDEDSYTGK